MADSKKFKVSSERRNSKRLVLLADGMKCEDFLQNPVMLYDHDSKLVIGSWENLQRVGNEWFALPKFDLADDFAKGIAGKVERDVIKACSLGVNPLAGFKRIAEDDGKEEIVLTEYNLKEISITPVPANKDALAIRLYDSNDQEINLETLHLSDLKFLQTIPQTNQMDITKLAKTLNLADDASEDAILKAIEDGKEARTELTALQKQIKEKQKADAEAILVKAIAEGRLDATKKPALLTFAESNFDAFKDIVEGMQKPVNLKDFTEQGAAAAAAKVTGKSDKTKDWTFEDWRKNDPKGLIQLKDSNWDGYTELFEAQFGHKPKKD